MSADRPERTQPRRGLVGRLLGGRYRVTRLVTAGASTLIADADDIEVDRPVTVKLIRPEWAEAPEFRRRFRNEMRRMSGLSHPHIAAVHDWGEETVGKRTTVYGVVEHLSGGSLRDLFDRGRYLDPSQALMVGLEACRGLDFAHRNGLVHTELIPSKLVFGDDRRLRIVDFGLSRLVGAHDWAEPATVPTHVARYASPEQALAQPIDGKSDVYSLALILVEAVTRSVPFAARSTVATLSARAGRLMPVSADLGPLASVLERAGRPDTADRSTAAEFGRGLVRVAGKLPRPMPIPIVVAAGRFDDDVDQMRRPNDPTGGIARPPIEPAPAVVPPVVTSPVPPPTDPLATEPAPAVLAPTDPLATEPAPTEPVPEEFAAAESAPTEPVPVEPAPTEPAPEEIAAADDDPASATLSAGEAAVAASALAAVAAVAAVAEPDAEPDPAPGPDAPPDPAPAPDAVSTPAPEPNAVPGSGPESDADEAQSTDPSPGADATVALPPPAPSAEPRLYDGDSDVTKDELAALVRNQALAVAAADASRKASSTDSRPTGSTSTTAGPARADDPTAAGATAPTATASTAEAEAATGPGTAQSVSTEARGDSWSSRLQTGADDRPRRRWLVALMAVVVLGALGGLATLAYVLFRVPTHEVPDLVDEELDPARALVGEFDWDIEVREERSDERPEAGLIIRTAPDAGSQLGEGAPFLIVVSEGPELRALPEIAGRPQSQAGTALAQLQLTPLATEAFDEDVPPGSVISWSVPSDPTLTAGSEVLPGTEVATVVSKGPEPRTIPDLAVATADAATVEQATARLEALRLVVELGEPVFSDEVPSGAVVSVTPVVAEQVERGSTVTLVPSKGVDLVVTPDLTGLTLAQARAALAEAGLQVGSVIGNSAGTVARATVAGDPATAGTEFRRGTAVDMAFI